MHARFDHDYRLSTCTYGAQPDQGCNSSTYAHCVKEERERERAHQRVLAISCGLKWGMVRAAVWAHMRP